MNSKIRNIRFNWRKALTDKDYLILEKIDEGSFGEVHAIHKQHDAVLYAVKSIMANGFVTDDEYILAEIRSLLQLIHPHIISMHDLILRDKFACIIMEYASHGNLENHTLRHYPICFHFLRTSFRQILSAVEFCHSKFIAHKDINPSNILIFSNQCVKLADFGLAVKIHDAFGDLVLCEDYLGQNSYLAPEVLRHIPHNAMFADMWSLGCLLYFMRCGKPPVEGSTDDIVEKQLSCELKLPNELNNTLDYDDSILRVITYLCQIDPTLRMTSCVALETWENLPDTTTITL